MARGSVVFINRYGLWMETRSSRLAADQLNPARKTILPLSRAPVLFGEWLVFLGEAHEYLFENPDTDSSFGKA
jgi:hypothetical protein